MDRVQHRHDITEILLKVALNTITPTTDHRYFSTEPPPLFFCTTPNLFQYSINLHKITYFFFNARVKNVGV